MRYPLFQNAHFFHLLPNFWLECRRVPTGATFSLGLFLQVLSSSSDSNGSDLETMFYINIWHIWGLRSTIQRHQHYPAKRLVVGSKSQMARTIQSGLLILVYLWMGFRLAALSILPWLLEILRSGLTPQLGSPLGLSSKLPWSIIR